MTNAYDNHDNLGTGVNWSALKSQVAGDHYTLMKQQPLEKTYHTYGYVGVKHSIYTKVDKYLTRAKGTDREDIEKAIHCLQLQLEFYDTTHQTALQMQHSITTAIDGNK